MLINPFSLPVTKVTPSCAMHVDLTIEAEAFFEVRFATGLSFVLLKFKSLKHGLVENDDPESTKVFSELEL